MDPNSPDITKQHRNNSSKIKTSSKKINNGGPATTYSQGANHTFKAKQCIFFHQDISGIPYNNKQSHKLHPLKRGTMKFRTWTRMDLRGTHLKQGTHESPFCFYTSRYFATAGPGPSIYFCKLIFNRPGPRNDSEAPGKFFDH
jgi:hypothetical protein